mmetsp:Transcript_44801/g.130477  ORF Transcript_44801/g.130477 Transcript_44801/m.130477 type:complete len:608 (+) Transcript_44801:350-2173(+)
MPADVDELHAGLLVHHLDIDVNGQARHDGNLGIWPARDLLRHQLAAGVLRHHDQVALWNHKREVVRHPRDWVRLGRLADPDAVDNDLDAPDGCLAAAGQRLHSQAAGAQCAGDQWHGCCVSANAVGFHDQRAFRAACCGQAPSRHRQRNGHWKLEVDERLLSVQLVPGHVRDAGIHDSGVLAVVEGNKANIELLLPSAVQNQQPRGNPQRGAAEPELALPHLIPSRLGAMDDLAASLPSKVVLQPRSRRSATTVTKALHYRRPLLDFLLRQTLPRPREPLRCCHGQGAAGAVQPAPLVKEDAHDLETAAAGGDRHRGQPAGVAALNVDHGFEQALHQLGLPGLGGSVEQRSGERLFAAGSEVGTPSALRLGHLVQIEDDLRAADQAQALHRQGAQRQGVLQHGHPWRAHSCPRRHDQGAQAPCATKLVVVVQAVAELDKVLVPSQQGRPLDAVPQVGEFIRQLGGKAHDGGVRALTLDQPANQGPLARLGCLAEQRLALPPQYPGRCVSPRACAPICPSEERLLEVIAQWILQQAVPAVWKLGTVLQQEQFVFSRPGQQPARAVHQEHRTHLAAPCILQTQVARQLHAESPGGLPQLLSDMGVSRVH